MYLRAKPPSPTLLDALGPWPWYIVSAAAVGLAMLLALGLLTDGVRRLDQRRFAHGGAELVWNQRVRGRGYS